GGTGVAGSSNAGAGGSAGSSVDASAGSGGGAGTPVVDASNVVDVARPRDAPPEIPCPGPGTALSFDRTKSQFVLIPTTVMPAGNSPRTIEMWVLNKSPIANWAPDHTLWEHGG